MEDEKKPHLLKQSEEDEEQRAEASEGETGGHRFHRGGTD